MSIDTFVCGTTTNPVKANHNANIAATTAMGPSTNNRADGILLPPSSSTCAVDSSHSCRCEGRSSSATSLDKSCWRSASTVQPNMK
eukprot:CCRYP_014433-RD/>CCRYP_014433-RD protein AED:0.18 eAED:0.21 QI:7573/0.9/0.90/1/0.9/0.81/11/0/85